MNRKDNQHLLLKSSLLFITTLQAGDEECTSVSITKGSSASRKVSFSWIDPCNGKPPEICLPIYFRIEAVDSGGLNCLTHEGNYPCRVANAVEVTIRHQGMTCGSEALLASASLSLIWIWIFTCYFAD